MQQAVSNEMTYSVIKGFHDLWLAENESRIRAELPILIVAGTDDPVGRKTATIQGLITPPGRIQQVGIEPVARCYLHTRSVFVACDRVRVPPLARGARATAPADYLGSRPFAVLRL